MINVESNGSQGGSVPDSNADVYLLPTPNWKFELLKKILEYEGEADKVRMFLKANIQQEGGVDWCFDDRNAKDAEDEDAKYFIGLTPLIAASMTDLDMVTMLVDEFQADVTFEGKFKKEGKYSITPLQAAVMVENEEILDYLSEKGADDSRKEEV